MSTSCGFINKNKDRSTFCPKKGTRREREGGGWKIASSGVQAHKCPLGRLRGFEQLNGGFPYIYKPFQPNSSYYLMFYYRLHPRPAPPHYAPMAVDPEPPCSSLQVMRERHFHAYEPVAKVPTQTFLRVHLSNMEIAPEICESVQSRAVS